MSMTGPLFPDNARKKMPKWVRDAIHRISELVKENTDRRAVWLRIRCTILEDLKSGAITKAEAERLIREAGMIPSGYRDWLDEVTGNPDAPREIAEFAVKEHIRVTERDWIPPNLRIVE